MVAPSRPTPPAAHSSACPSVIHPEQDASAKTIRRILRETNLTPAIIPGGAIAIPTRR